MERKSPKSFLAHRDDSVGRTGKRPLAPDHRKGWNTSQLGYLMAGAVTAGSKSVDALSARKTRSRCDSQ